MPRASKKIVVIPSHLARQISVPPPPAPLTSTTETATAKSPAKTKIPSVSPTPDHTSSSPSKPPSPNEPRITLPSMSKIDNSNLLTLKSTINNFKDERVEDVEELSRCLHNYFNRVPSEEILGEIISSGGEVFSVEDYVSSLPTAVTSSPEITDAKELLTRWRETLKPGATVSANDEQSIEPSIPFLPKWFKAVVVEVSPASTPVKDYLGVHTFPLPSLKITFNGFTARHDKWYQTDSLLVMPSRGCGGAKGAILGERKARKEKVKLEQEEVKRMLDREKEDSSNKMEVEEKEETVTTKRGRKTKRCTSIPKPRTKKPKVCKTAEECVAAEVPEWVCQECNEIEAALDPDAPLLICEGPCIRTFHTVCVGVKEVPEGEWICEDCKSHKHQCLVCNEYGVDNVEGGVVKCSKKKCGRYYHESCVRNYNFDVDEKWVEENERAISEGGGEFRPLKFVCPAHYCWSCMDTKKEERKKWAKKEKEIFTCLHCPIGYHLSCIPPLANFHELALLCHEHSDRQLPEMNPEASVLMGEQVKKVKQKAVERKRKAVVGAVDVTEFDFITKYEGFTVPPMILPNEGGGLSPEQEDAIAFKLPINIQAEVFSKPPKYTNVSGLKYSANRPPRKKIVDRCNCVSVNDGGNGCDEDCLNRTLYIECFEKNCNIGEECGNRRLSKKQVARCRPEREMGKGWGLVALDDVEVGELVGEYVGEILSEQEMNKRMEDWDSEHPNDPNFYVMELEGGWYIDARVKGNLTRFINHSCDPNCQLQRTNVAGDIRIAVVCTRPVPQGEFLCYDYQFDTEHAAKFACACGAEKCRGTMKGGKDCAYKEEEKEKTKAEQLRDAKVKEEKDRNFIARVQETAVKRLDQTDLLVPESGGAEELVLAGPLAKYKNFVMERNVALWRNVEKGFSGLIMSAQDKLK